MKKIIAIMLMMAMLICGCGKAENTTTEPTNATSVSAESTKGTDSVTEAPTEEVTEPSSAATETSEAPSNEATETTEPSSEESTDTIEDPEPDPYAEIKANPLPLLDLTLGEFEAIYGDLEIKEYFKLFKTDEAYTPILDMYFETDGGLYRAKGIRRDQLIRGIVVTRLDSLGVEAGMSSDEIDLSGWELYIGASVTVHGETWNEPPVDGTGAIPQYTDDYKSGRTLSAFKEIGEYWYNIYFLMPEEYEECDYSTSDSFWWRDAFAEEVRAKKRSLIVSRIEVRKKGTETH